MKKDLIDIIMEKEYHELTASERAELQEFCANESEYNQMKDVFVSVESMKFESPQPRKETKERLDNLFAETYPKAGPIWYSSVGAAIVPKDKPLHRQPLMQIAAVGLLLVLIYPLWNTKLEESPKSQSASIEKELETVSEKENKSVTAEAEPVNSQDLKEESSKDLVASNVTVETRNDRASGASGVSEPGSVASPSFSPATMGVSAGTTSTFAFTNNSSVSDFGAGDSSIGTGLDHPDGVFVAVSQPASDEPELLDLLTTTF